MYDKLCIIMADGKAKRMEGLNKKKQLIEVNGERIIDRTIRQIRALGVEPVIATHFDDFNYLDIARIIPENNTHEITKFNANKKYYEKYDEVTFIWGDTYFEDQDIAMVINTEVDTYKFFGTKYEILGFKIKKPYYHLIDEATDYIINKPDIDYGNSGTWGMLRYIGGHPLILNPNKKEREEIGVTSQHEPLKYAEEGLLQFIPGLSMDNDGMDDLVSFCKRFPDAKVEELRYKDKDGAEYIFRDKKWQQLIKLTGGE